MKDPVIYRPYRANGWCVPLMAACWILSLIGAGYCMADFGWYVLFFIFVGLGSLWLTKFLYDSSHIVIYFEKDGVRIVGAKEERHKYFPWEAFSHVSYAQSFRGHLFAVLSPDELDAKEARKFANRAANSWKAQIWFRDVVVVHVDGALSNQSQLKELIDSHVQHIDGTK